jgi:hypothetical protein
MKYFSHNLLQKTKQALKLRLLFQVALFLQFHRTTSALLEEVSKWGEPRHSFDAEHMIIDTTERNKYRSELDDTDEVFIRDPVQVNSPDDLSNHYK